MLLKHLENVRQKSDNYKTFYAFSVSLLFTGVVAGLWAFSFFIPEVSGASNSASVAGAIDNSKDISPAAVVGQQSRGVFNTLSESISSLFDGSLLAGANVKFVKGGAVLGDGSEENSLNASDTSSSTSELSDQPISPDASSVSSSNTSVKTRGGITVEAENKSDSNADEVSGN